jgi:hypothetical protein
MFNLSNTIVSMNIYIYFFNYFSIHFIIKIIIFIVTLNRVWLTQLKLDFQQPNINQVKLLAFENRLIQDSTEFVFNSDFMFGRIIIV